jgi:drug/metabolite transporter (DMT)-like permease
MTLLGFALVLTAAFCHATWNFCVKRIDAGPELIWLFSAVSTVIYLPFALWIILVEQPHLGFWQLVFIFGSVILHLGYFTLLQAGYRNGDLSLVYPIARATGPVLSTALAVLLLGEVITWQTALGAAIIIFGVVSLTGGFGRRAENVSASLMFGLGTGFLIGCYTAWDAYAVAVLLVPPLIQDYVSTLGRVILLAPIAHRRRSEVARIWREHRVSVIAIAVFSTLAYVLVLYALTFTPVVFVAPTREISVLLTVIAGSVLLGEGHLKSRLTWAAVILMGVAILATS